MAWVKQGLIFEPPQRSSWLVSHSAVPCALPLEENRYRIYFTGRDGSNRSHISYFEIDLENPGEILTTIEHSILAPGPLGSFDEHGAMTSWVLRHREQVYMYYTGWTRGSSVPFVNSIGLAVSDDDGLTFRKISEGPILSRNTVDPYLVANPCVLKEGDQWRMWYLSAVKWVLKSKKPKHYYHIRYAQSADGIIWKGEGKVCIDFQSANEYAISRPCVIQEKGNRYRMWYSFRGERYRIGYAESPDGCNWERLDSLAGIETSDSGWDSEMIEYGFVFRHQGDYYMLYNGNDYGRSGIGLAIWEK